jgi:O-antigen/teichoic acid export membrane protein
MPSKERDHSFVRRLLAGMSGQIFIRLVAACSMVISVPLMLRGWGATGYGEWIALTSLTSYLSYSNFGILTPSVNEIIMAVGAHDVDRARRQLGMTLSFCLFVVAPLLSIGALGLSAVDFRVGLNFVYIANAECVSVVVAMVCSILAQTLRGAAVGALYAEGAYGLVYFASGSVRLTELIAVSTLLSIWPVQPSTIAWIMAGLSVLELLVATFLAKRQASWVSFKLHGLEKRWILDQLRPASGFLISNFSTQAVLLLGPRVVLSLVSGGGAVSIYALYGTAMRLVDQIVLVFLSPLEIEFARSAGKGDLPEIAHLVRTGTHGAWIVFAAISLAAALVGPFIFDFWTRGQIIFQYHLLFLTCLMFAANQFGRVCAQALNATNRMFGLSFWMLAASVAALGCGALLSLRFGVEGMFVGGILGELGVSLIVTSAVAYWLKLPVSALLLDFSSFRSSLIFLRRRLATRGREALQYISGR